VKYPELKLAEAGAPSITARTQLAFVVLLVNTTFAPSLKEPLLLFF
jgi:hypothetical protein